MDEKIDKADWKYVPVDPEDGFDAEHNRRVIRKTIRKHEKTKRVKDRQYTELVAERTSALAQYLKSLQTGKTTSSAEKYFGQKELTYLRGQEIMDELYERQKKKEREEQAG